MTTPEREALAALDKYWHDRTNKNRIAMQAAYGHVIRARNRAKS